LFANINLSLSKSKFKTNFYRYLIIQVEDKL
jgi:hypothetical protein